MSNGLEIVSALIQLRQLAANVGISMQALVDAQKQAEIEGREFGPEDLEILRNKVDKNLSELARS